MKHLAFIAFGSLWLAAAQAQSGTFTEIHDIKCGDTLAIGSLGYPTWNPPQIVRPARYGSSVLLGDFIPANILEYIAPPFFSGRDTVVIECAHATQITCDTGIYIFNVTCDSPAQQVEVLNLACNDTVSSQTFSSWSGPYIGMEPQHGEAQILLFPTDGASVQYVPDAGFEGTDWVLVNHANNIFPSVLFVFHIDCQFVGTGDEPTFSRLDIFPNPTSDIVQMRLSSEKIEKISLHDALGRSWRLDGFSQNDGLLTIPVGHLPSGMFRATVWAEGRLWAGTFLKIK